MTATSDLMHLAAIGDALQRRHGFTLAEMETNRGQGSRAAAIALERSIRLSSASLGRIFVAGAQGLHWADYTLVWPKQSSQAALAGDEVTALRLKVALIILYWLGAPLGAYAGDGWGDAYTGYTLSAA